MNGECVNAEFVPIASASQALAETNISMNGECVGEEFVPIATTSQALAETNISMNCECVNAEFVPIASASQALAETNISMNGECVGEEFVPIATTNQALVETNISMNGECVGEEFVPIATTSQEVSCLLNDIYEQNVEIVTSVIRALPFVVHSSENNLSGSDIVDSSKVTTDTFSNVMLRKVKTKGRPNNKQHFTKKKRPSFPYSSVKNLKLLAVMKKKWLLM
ncbi:hypothetical protein BgiBS90_033655 [Biomphalaria glabrata]|nr:hypothetical protein BgiBS90_033655 [Biomphalaria glabrata]